ncbi:hypothetical protein ACQW02_28100 [Humitalea sp. 24SJ18S-53]|uniref:hypothetical protein n=1 Tax=Humitalea sp. 24SJ18S-53 TaxID=3422307 RepID=UPI003D675A54
MEGTRPGRPTDDVRPGYYRTLAGSHILFFRHPDAGTLDGNRILHQRMDIASHL